MLLLYASIYKMNKINEGDEYASKEEVREEIQRKKNITIEPVPSTYMSEGASLEASLKE